jgi:DNA-binding transcriptional LysR family regulator
MELRHLRFFVAVAEEKSITVAAKRRLHTAQPSLSRQLRELETEVGAELITRRARGIELTAAGRVFLDHARLALAQVEAAAAGARRAAHPEQRTLALGFLSGCEPAWLPAAMHVLRDELPKIEVTISSKHSPQLADCLAAGKLDVAFLRPEQGYPDLVYKALIREPLIVVLPSDHRLASREAISPEELVGETFIGMWRTKPRCCARSLTTIFDVRASSSRQRTRPNISPWRCRSSRQRAGWRYCPILPATTSLGRSSAVRWPVRRPRSTWSWVITRPTTRGFSEHSSREPTK